MNVARFLTHKCENANLVDMPVMIDEVNWHYYHVVFFAKRKIDPYKELTWIWLLFIFFFWYLIDKNVVDKIYNEVLSESVVFMQDYGIDFYDVNDNVPLFAC